MKRVAIALMLTALVSAPAHAGPRENKQLVANFIHDVFEAKNPEAARKYLAPDYIQHNPHVGPGLDGFIKSMNDWLSHAPPDMTDETLHLIGDGDLVVAHQKVTYTGKDGTKKSATGFDLFRVSQGRIVEHWDADD